MDRLRLNSDVAEKPPPYPKDRPLGVGTRLTEKLLKDFCELVAEGLPCDGVCDYLGVWNTTYWDWIQKGQKYLNGNDQPPQWEIFGKFVKRLRRAMAKYRLDHVRKLHAAGKGTWIREMAILERRDRKSFSRFEPNSGTEEAFDPDERFM